MKVTLVTQFIHPPIGTRYFDWCAYPEYDEESMYYGWGRTEVEAIEDWKDNFGEYDSVKAKKK